MKQLQGKILTWSIIVLWKMYVWTIISRSGRHENFIPSFKCAVLEHGIIYKNKIKSTV